MNMSFISWEQPFDLKEPPVPAVFVRKEFEIRPGLKQAELKMTALGHYIPYINGKKPDEQLFTPGYTEYSARLQYQTYDVTALLAEGANVIGALVGDGWYRGSCGPTGMRATYGDQLALAACLTLTYEDGTETVTTDTDWKWSDETPYRSQDIRMIEHYDARMEKPDWCEPGYDVSDWHSCIPASYAGKLIPAEGEVIKAHEHFRPEVLHTPDGSVVLDFKQNLAGYVCFTVTGHEGQTVRLLHGEVLDEKGNFTTKNLGGEKVMKLGQEIVYDLKEGTQTYAPAFLVCGFRYVKLIDWPEEVKPENFESVAVYSDLTFTGSFECSSDKINRLVKNVEWSLKSNFLDIPTDCPQRERAGWTGDINVFIECADLFADTRKFISKWMKDVVLTVTAEGAPLAIVPRVYMMNRKNNEATPGAAGWADAVTQIPMRQYMVYKDRAILEDSYEAMKNYVEYNVARAKKKGNATRFKKDEESQYILDTGFHYGEWLEPGEANMAAALKAAVNPDAEVATAWFYYSAKTLSETAEILGKNDDASHYHELAEKIKAAYQKYFVKNGNISSERQCRFVRPLYMGLLTEKSAEKAAMILNDMIIQNGYKIGTGFLSTYQILNVLSDAGYHETACRMLENEECPGWLYEVNKGATTIWEGWDAIDPKSGKVKSKSLNHYSPGAALSWLWTRLCGIRACKPGYEEIVIAPKPGGSLTNAKASYDSISGRIVSAWSVTDDTFTLECEIPEGVQATVILPDGTRYENAESGTYSCAYDAKAYRTGTDATFPLNASIAELQKLPQFKEVGKYLMYSPGILGKLVGMLKISEAETAGWNSTTLIRGMKRLEQFTAKGRCVYPVYTKEECKDDRQKKDVNVLFMPADSRSDNKPFIVMCPGGGYSGVCSIVEGYPAAADFNQLGYDVFIVTYRVTGKGILPKPVDDLAAALKYIFKHRETFGVGEEYAVCGFSAGANLISIFGTDNHGYKSYRLPKPVAMMPVYTFINHTIAGDGPVMKSCLKAMFGDKPTEELMKEYDVDEHMSRDYPPCYIVCGKDDSTVPAVNSERLKEKLDSLGIPAVLEEGEHAEHGFGSGDDTDVEGWIGRAAEFIENL